MQGEVSNAAKINELHRRIHETFSRRHTGSKALAEWKDACQQFSASYDRLAVRGGLAATLQKIQSNDPDAIEIALVFLETHPYFFRSQYIRTKFLRRLKHAELNPDQRKRFEVILAYSKKIRG